MKGTADIDAGVCGFTAHITADAEDAFGVCAVTVETNCPNFEGLETLEIDIMDTMKKGYDSELCRFFRRNTPPLHTGCAVANGIYQAVKVAAGFALPRDIVVRLKKR
ncbi:MAG: hypothetical protein JXQ30_00685 [Spirochaetes bacterium]|nr:hypothetical protein [Spirochaetota bacterium]